MKKEFHFEVTTRWQHGEFENLKSHVSKVNGLDELVISAASEFKGDKQHHNPEDLLLRSLSSCHMMSYFYVCQQHGIELLRYSDQATGTLTLREDNSGAFSKVVLQPIVRLKDESQETLALSLHQKAHELCFIANSVSFLVEIFPTTTSQ